MALATGSERQELVRRQSQLRCRFGLHLEANTSFAILFTLLAIHASILAYGSYVNAPAKDEVGHLTAGLSHLELQKFDLYRVNPPLVRTIAAIPLWLSSAKRDWSEYVSGNFGRPEFPVGRHFFKNNGPEALKYFFLGRLVCIPFSLITMVLCYAWGKELFGRRAGIVAAGIWCFLPEAIGNGQMLTPDMGATAVGLGLWFAFRRWLKSSTWTSTLVAGALLGLALLTKTTWLIAFPIAFLMWIATKFRSLNGRTAIQLLFIFLASIYFVNLGYLFEGTGKKLGDYSFICTKLSGETSQIPGNRFKGTWLGDVPIPLPENFVRGIDVQKYEFDEKEYDSFLDGEWRKQGWWYYYLYALLIKTPLAMVLLGGLASLQSARSLKWQNGVELLLPGAFLITFVSSQTGFNHHLRYVLPAMPYFVIWASSCMSARNPLFRKVVAVLFCWIVASTLFATPHCHSYFNELIGGPRAGFRHLHDSNVDWGQDTFRVLHWKDGQDEIEDFYFAHYCVFPLRNVMPNVLWSDIPQSENIELQPGCYAVSVNQLNRSDGKYDVFNSFEPEHWIGYSTRVYRLSQHDIDQVSVDQKNRKN